MDRWIFRGRRSGDGISIFRVRTRSALVLPGIEPDILQRRPDRAPRRELEAALTNCRMQWGDTLYTALHAYNGDIGAVMDRIMGTKHSQRLLEAGVLLVDHD